MYVGFSPLHSSTVGLICNLRTGNISPQFHLIYDDWFETVHASATEEPEVWQELIKFSRFANDLDDDQYVPELSKEWLNKEEVEARAKQEQRIRQGQPQPQREQTPEIQEVAQAPAVPVAPPDPATVSSPPPEPPPQRELPSIPTPAPLSRRPT